MRRTSRTVAPYLLDSKGLSMNSMRWLSIAPLFCTLFATNPIHGEQPAHYYDATHSKPIHQDLGLHKHVQPMRTVYESAIFKDKQSAYKHYKTGDLPDSNQFLQWLKSRPNWDVMLDIESLNGPADPETKKAHNEYLIKIVKSIRSQARVLGLDDRTWFWYGAPYTPRGDFANLKVDKVKLRKNKESLQPLHDLFDYYAVPCYDRYDGPENTDRFRRRAEVLKACCDIVDKPAYAIMTPTFPAYHVSSKLQGKPKSLDLTAEHFEILNSIFDGVIQWQAPKNYVPSSIREEAAVTRHHLLEIMNRSASDHFLQKISDD